MDGKGGDGEKEGKRTVLLLILVGAPGSGKSTFCDQVMKATTSSRTWIRICQDTIANGKSGTKIQCLKRASDALKGGNSVFIDRCNLDIDQRSEFMKLGGSSPYASTSDFSVDIHGVVLDLPARICISRSVKRSTEEHSLHGGKAAAVVNKMLQKKELPKLTEGFSRITFCQNENDVGDAVNTYANLGPFDSLPSGCFGKKVADSKVQLGIMRFMKKIDPSTTAIPDGNCSKDVSGTKPGTTEICQPGEGPTNGSNPSKESKQYGRDTSHHLSSKNIHTLAFPSISTSDFQFDINMASDIIIESVGAFLNKTENVRLVFVDLTHRSNIFSLVRSKAMKANIDPQKFLTVVGDITKLSTEGNICCNVIANAANWRLKPSGGGVNAAIFKAAGEALEIATRKCAGTLNPGNSIAVPLPSTSPLYQREGVTHVIHVLGPNMNPQRPSCLKNDYNKGCKILHDSYSSLFENFANLDRNRKYINREGDLVGILNIPNKVANADLKTKRDALTEPERIKKCKGDSEQFVTRKYDLGDNSLRSESSVELNVKEKVWGSWAQALHKIAMNPEKHQALILEETDDYVVLNDLYPKAKKHVLILAKLYGLDRISDVRKEHLPLVKKMHSAGLRFLEKFLKEESTLIFRMGYHMIPSMRQLHLHVISQDFDSPNLKNKKHWNSFNTAFFRDSADVIEEIDNTGRAVTINDHDKLLSTELRCHKCRSAHPNVPKLKSHINRCSCSLPESLLQNGRLFSSTFPNAQ